MNGHERMAESRAIGERTSSSSYQAQYGWERAYLPEAGQPGLRSGDRGGGWQAGVLAAALLPPTVGVPLRLRREQSGV